MSLKISPPFLIAFVALSSIIASTIVVGSSLGAFQSSHESDCHHDARRDLQSSDTDNTATDEWATPARPHPAERSPQHASTRATDDDLDNDDCRQASCDEEGSAVDVMRAWTDGHRRQVSRDIIIASEHRQARSRGASSRGFGSSGARQDNGENPQEYSRITEYLVDFDESPEEVRDPSEILVEPSNIVQDEDFVGLVAWDPRDREPRGSYLYVLQQGVEARLAQIHRYFCTERRLDILAESCVPIASVYSDEGAPVAVGYTDEGQPRETEVDDLDPELFSQGNDYTEANEMLLKLQEYFDSLRV